MMTLAVTGHRDLSASDRDRIEVTMAEIVETDPPGSILFGGARGSDSVALKAAHNHRPATTAPELVAVVPWTLKDQPTDAVETIEDCADRVDELRSESPVGRAAGYFERNEALVDRAGELVAFWSGKRSGGTFKTLQYARDQETVSTRTVKIKGG